MVIEQKELESVGNMAKLAMMAIANLTAPMGWHSLAKAYTRHTNSARSLAVAPRRCIYIAVPTTADFPILYKRRSLESR